MWLDNRDPCIILRSHNIGGAQAFPKVWEQSQKSRLQDGDVRRGPTNITRHPTKFRTPGELVARIWAPLSSAVIHNKTVPLFFVGVEFQETRKKRKVVSNLQSNTPKTIF